MNGRGLSSYGIREFRGNVRNISPKSTKIMTMERKIKFRGKDAFTGKWVYGDLVQNQKVTENGLEPRVMVGGYEVNPDTVGQFTGLYDREGNEIFEGDVVTGLEYADFHTGDDGNVNAVVVWDTEWASFMLDAGCRVNIRPCADIRRRIRVTGNIHDNPPLLEGGLKCFTT